MTTPITDGSWTLFRADPESGRMVWWQYTDEGISWRIEEPADVSIAYNAEMEKQSQGYRFGEYRLMGSIPAMLYQSSGLEEAMTQHDSRYIRRWFNDSDNAKFRGSRGRF